MLPPTIRRSLAVVWCLGLVATYAATGSHPAAYGLSAPPSAQTFLKMPEQADRPMPRLLSQTGAFRDVATLTPADGLIPYDLNVPFWSDGAGKERWIAVPTNTTIQFAPTGEWKFPPGTVFVKHFELATNATHPEWERRLETRLVVCNSTGGVYGVTYKWRADNSDAELLPTNLSEAIVIQTATGTRTQTWYYPSREDCLVCHTPLAGDVLGVKTRQLNRDFTYPSGIKANELRAWSELGLFNSSFNEANLPHYEKLATEDDPTRSIEDRARSYLDANCAHCHRPGSTVASFDARYDTPLAKQNLIDAPVLIDEGIDRARAIAPNDIWRSIVYMRPSRLDGTRMPPLAHEELDQRGLALLRQWIESMPGPPVLSPPEISPRGGDYHQPVTVILQPREPGATIRYTVDGSVPMTTDALYEKPIRLTGPTIVRAKSFQPGHTRSITAQEVFNIGE